MSCFIILDSGSSFIKALAINNKGEIKKILKKELNPEYKGLKVEYNSKTWLKLNIEIVEEIVSSTEEEILGLGISSQRSSFVIWDKNNKEPLTPILSWQDSRSKDENYLKISNKEIHNITGLYFTPYYSASKIKYLLKDKNIKRKVFSKQALISPLPTYLLWHLSNGEFFISDPTMAQRTLLFDINKNIWSDKLLENFNIPDFSLPKIVDSFTKDLFLNIKGKKIPFLGMLGDQQSAVFPFLEEGLAVSNYGTGAFILTGIKEKKINLDGILTSISYSNFNKNQYMLEGTVNSCGTFLKWLNVKLGVKLEIEKLDEIISKAKNEEIFVLPAIGGIGSPHWDYDTKTSFSGFSSETGIPEVLKASIEGIVFLMNEAFEKINKKNKIKEIISSGGLSFCDYLLKFQSEIMNIKVSRTLNLEGSAKGLAFFFAKNLLNEKNWDFNKDKKIFIPSYKKDERENKIKKWKIFFQNTRKIYFNGH